MKISFLTKHDGFNRGESCDVYPLIRWKKDLQAAGIEIKYFRSHSDKGLFENEVVCIDHRYYWNRRKEFSKKSMIKFLSSLKENGNKIIFFDNSDGPGSVLWDFIEYVDVFVKKQVYRDKKLYVKNRGYKNLNIFSDSYNLSPEQRDKNRITGEKFKPCPSEHVHKVTLGWNIGMYDYRNFPFSGVYPLGIYHRRFLNSVYSIPTFYRDFDKKIWDSSFRGDIKKGDENYSWQRNRVITIFKMNKNLKLKTGKIIPKNRYLKELRESKTCVSPFGHGEICYRDFEAIINGCVLIKPDMSHILTWPDIYKKNETYVSIEWDLSDLEEKLYGVINHYQQYKEMVINSQDLYNKSISDSRKFIKRFKKIIRKASQSKRLTPDDRFKLKQRDKIKPFI